MAGFDYVVVGGGAAGCVLANRLSENPKVHVALVDASATGWTLKARNRLRSGKRGAWRC